MTHPHESTAQKALKMLLGIPGVFACAVRAHAEAPKTPTEIREEAEGIYDVLPADKKPVDVLGSRKEWVDAMVRGRLEETRRHLAEAPAPLPHITKGSEDLVHYLRGLTDLLGPGHDERIQARIGSTRMVAESWDHLIVAVAIAVNDEGNKSLARGLRRVCKTVRKT